MLRRRWIIAFAAAAAALLALPIAVTSSALLPLSRPIRGLDAFQANIWVLGVPLLLGYLAAFVIVAVAAVAWRGHRLQSLVVWIAVTAALYVTFGHLGQWTQRVYLRRIALIPQRMQPLITALGAYREATGEYPATMDALVPKYLARIPDTGTAEYRVVEYATSDDGFELRVRSIEFAALQELLYRSNQDYSEYGRARPIDEIIPDERPTYPICLLPQGWLFWSFD